MTNLTLICGGNNRASNQTPQAGDALDVISSSTINVSGNDMSGDYLGGQAANETLNVSHHAPVDLGVSDSGSTIVNISGTDTVNFTGIDQAAVIVDLAPNATWIGTFDGAGKYSGDLTINGSANSVLLTTAPPTPTT